MKNINDWTETKQMKLNEKKTKNMIFNFTHDNQFSTDIKLKGETIETVRETKLLGVYINDKLNWNDNTRNIVRESNKRMRLLHRARQFTRNIKHLKQIYMLQVRSKLEQSAVLWHSGITRKDCQELERIQKSAMKVIFGNGYKDYQDALKKIGLDTLEKRRDRLCLDFAKGCLKIEKLKKIFPLNNKKENKETRNKEKYVVNIARTERYKKSAIPFMQRLLNNDVCEKKKIIKKINEIVPVNNGSFYPYHCENKAYK